MLWCASMPCGLPADDSDSHRPLRQLQRRPREDRVPQRPRRTATAGACRPSPASTTTSRCLRGLGAARPTERDRAYFALIRNFRRHSWLLLYLFGASPAVCASFVAGREHELADADARHAVPAVRHVAAHGAARLPERRAGVARGELQQPGELRARRCRTRSPRPYPPYEAIGIARRRRVPPARHEPAADRERVLRHDPPEAHHPPRRAAAARAARARRRVRRGAPDGPRSLLPGRHRGGHDALPRRVPAALPARRQPARHAGGDRGASRATSTASRSAAASRASRSCAGGRTWRSSNGAGRCSPSASRSPRRSTPRTAGSLYREALAAAVAALGDAASVPSARVLREMRARFDGSFLRFALAHSAQHRRALEALPFAAEAQQRFARLAEESLAEQRRDRGCGRRAVRDVPAALPAPEQLRA